VVRAVGEGVSAPRFPLRFRDLDAFGHVYHAEYLTLLDEARTAWFRDVLRLDDAGDYVLARVEVDYVSSLVRTDRWVTASFEVERVGGTSLTLRETLLAQDGRVVTRGRAVCVLRDPAAGTSRRVTDAERARVEALTAP
jgi:acyl-CoA thioester hydrolase